MAVKYNKELNETLLAMLSESISGREKREIKLHNVMETEDHRPSIEIYDKTKIITRKSRGSIRLMTDEVIFPKEVEELSRKNKIFFSRRK